MLSTFTWDAVGYYMYLPGQYIYHDVKHLNWWNEISKAYQLPGNFYQASLQPNGNYVMFYSIGIALLQTPFFFAGHVAARILNYPQDGFSAPYQIAISMGMMIYVFIGIYFLRKVLLRCFSDRVVAWILILTTLATNYPQYTAVQAGMTHGYLFTLYCLLLYFTIRWHDHPTLQIACAIGFIVGLATVCRPTEAVMIFIPLLWNTHSKELRKTKWLFLKNHIAHLVGAVISGFIALLPQFIYWKYATGNWIHKMGSKWDFLDPHWHVLIGWEKGWFIYTPVTIFMVAGLFFMKKKEYTRSVISYFILNLWIIIAWHEWRYGGTYSCRALTQSLAVLSIPLGVFLEKVYHTRWRLVGIALSVFLFGVNLFQLWQFNKTIIHYDDMNRRYYAAVYLNPSPSPIDMSLLDTDECIDTSGYNLVKQIQLDSSYTLLGGIDSVRLIMNKQLSSIYQKERKQTLWLNISAYVKSDWGAYDSHIVAELFTDKLVKSRAIRMQNGICDISRWNKIEFFFAIPPDLPAPFLKIHVTSPSIQTVMLKDFRMLVYTK